MSKKSKRIVYVASKEQLTNPHYLLRLWLAARNMPFSRRSWPDVLTLGIYGFNGVILCPNGRPWPVPDIDAVMGDPRWLSYYFEEIEGKPKRSVRVTERLRLIDLWFRIARPEIQKHFER